MEGQITLTEWMQWREDIRRKLQETASNFVYIGYRLKQIRDSGMYDGCEDIFEFAQKEYGLSKSITSRFIAINEKFSEGGNSLEIREEYKALGSSKLSEMLTLSEEDCRLITAKTTVKEIRELKHFNKQVPEKENHVEVECIPEELMPQEPQQKPKELMAAVQHTPLQKCIVDFFKDRKDVFIEVMELLENGWQVEEAAKAVNPGDYITHKKGIVFLFMYDYKGGVAYKQMGQPDPVKMTWDDFLDEVAKVYEGTSQLEDWSVIWDEFYRSKTTEKTEPKMPENRGNTPVATSQQSTKKAEELPPEKAAEVLGTEAEEETKTDSVDVNKIVSEDHSSQVGKMIDPTATAYNLSPVDHLANAGEMVEAEQNVDVNKMVPNDDFATRYNLKRVDHGGEASEMVPEEHIPEAGKMIPEEPKAENPNMAAAPVKLTEEETEVIPPPKKATEWRHQVNKCLSNLQAEVKIEAWQAAKSTLRHMEHYIDLVMRTEQ